MNELFSYSCILFDQLETMKFDVIIFGASGHIGRYTILEAIKKLNNLKWAVAGRNMEKLQFILNWAADRTNVNLSNIQIILGNANDQKSLLNITGKCRVLINCCGPPQLYSECILRCCIQTGTHYVDVSTDPYFNELMQLRYHDKALQNSTYVISSCGFHSFPIEIGLNILQENFEGTINHVDAYVQYKPLNTTTKLAPIASDTVWQTLIMNCATLGDLPLIRKDIRKTPWPTLMPKQPIKKLLHKPIGSGSEIHVRFPIIDKQTVESSQYLFYIMEKRRPIQFYKYLIFPSQWFAVLFIIWALVISICAQFQKSRRLLLSYPRFFSLGQFSAYGPDEEFMQNFQFKIILNASGWSQPILPNNACSLNKTSLDRHMALRITGTNPFYGITSSCLVLSAIVILEEQNKMPYKGGVYTPAVAFHKTSIRKKLEACDSYLTIEISE